MTIEQFMALLQHIQAEHTQTYANTKRAVRFQIPSAIEPPEGPLYDRIMAWLDEAAG